VSDRDYFFGTEGGLEPAVRAAAILCALYYAVDVLEVFPDEPANAWVVGNALFCAVGKDVPSFRAADRNVVDVRYGDVGYLWL